MNTVTAPAQCSEDGCLRAMRSNGLCATCYARHRRHGTLPARTRNLGTSNGRCSAPDCDRAVGRKGAKGLCPKHYQRLTKTSYGLTDPRRSLPDRERFLAQVGERGQCTCGCSCERWTGGTNKGGYGHFYLDGRTQLAHRVAYVFAFDEIPVGLIVDHVRERGCVHTDCVRPGHLEAVTDAVNRQRAFYSETSAENCRKGLAAGLVSRWQLRETLRERFLRQISVELCPCGCACRRWVGTVNKKTGYGNISVNGSTELAHRVAWVLANGREVPDGLIVDHVRTKGCIHRDCVNPGHLEAVTRRVNAQRARRGLST